MSRPLTMRATLGAVVAIAVAAVFAHHLSAQDLKELRRVRVAGGKTTCLAFSPNSRFLAAGGYGGDVVIWDVTVRQRIRTLDVDAFEVHSIAFSPQGRRIAALTQRLSIWDVATGTLLQSHPHGGGSAYRATPRVAWHPNGKTLAFGLDDNEIGIFDTETARLTASRTFGARTIGITFSPDGKELAVGLESKPVAVWDLTTGRVSHAAITNWATMAVYLPDGNRVVGTWDCAVLVDGCDREPIKLNNSVQSMAVAKDGSVLAVVPHGRKVFLFDGQGRPRGHVEHPTGTGYWTMAMALSQSGSLLATGGGDTPILLWRGTRKIAELEGQAATASSMGFSKNGTHMVVCAAGWAVITDLRSGRRRDLGPAHAVGDGWRRSEILVAHGRSCQIVDAATGRTIGTFPVVASKDEDKGEAGESAVDRVAGSPAGGVVSVAGRLWRLQGYRIGLVPTGGVDAAGDEARPKALPRALPKPKPLLDHEFAHDMSWTPDGKYVAIASELAVFCGNAPRLGKLAVYDREGQRCWSVSENLAAGMDEQQRLELLTGVNHTAAFSLDGKHLTFARDAAIYRVRMPYAAGARGKEPAKRVAGTVRWWRHLGPRLAISHDRQCITFWDAKRLASIKSVNVLGVREPGKGSPCGPVFIHGAKVSPDRRMVALASSKDVILFEVVR